MTSADAAPHPEDALGRRAGIVTRVAANALDWFVVFGVWVTAVLGWELFWALVTGGKVGFSSPPAWVSVIGVPLVLFVYLGGAWAATGKTLGKQLVGLRVLRASGQRLKPGRAFLRAALCLFVPGTPGLMWATVSRKNASWQDLMLRTAVVYDWHQREPWLAGRRAVAVARPAREVADGAGVEPERRSA
ncbi:MAG: RDD family protein [Acidimicrobiales bacterium]|nr:RDD family protein [Acidimicrobiales bacterium]